MELWLGELWLGEVWLGETWLEEVWLGEESSMVYIIRSYLCRRSSRADILY